MADPSDRKCRNCGANLTPGGYYCEFCDTDWSNPDQPPSAPPNTAQTLNAKDLGKWAKSSQGQLMIFILLATFFAPAALVYMWTNMDWSKKTKLIVTFVFALPILFFLLLVFGSILVSGCVSVLTANLIRLPT